jgi:hypothetical protein
MPSVVSGVGFSSSDAQTARKLLEIFFDFGGRAG